MEHLRNLTARHFRKLLSLVLAALAMQAVMPAGVMVAPAAGHGAAITLCPQTHPLARAAAEAALAAESHAAMGHGVVDHAAMEHAPQSADDEAPASSPASPAQSCAFAGACALAGLLPELADAPSARQIEPPAPPLPLQPLQLAATPRLRPPLRAPPALI